MTLKDLFVSYNQVEPVKFNFSDPNIPKPIYLNLDKIQQIIHPEQKTSDTDKIDMSVWKVQINENQNKKDYKTRLRNWIGSKEGFSEIAYKDGNYYSIGYGFNGPQYNANSIMTREEADLELDRQLTERESKYQKRFGQKWDNLTDNQKIALISYGYNVGDNRIINGTIAKHLDAWELDKVRDAISIDKARDRNGKLVTLPGLTKRRQQERELFDTK